MQDYIPGSCVYIRHHGVKRPIIIVLDVLDCIDMSKIDVEEHICREPYGSVFTGAPLI